MVARLRSAGLDDLRSALAPMEAACNPAEPALVLKELARCFVSTKAREHDSTDLEAMAVAFADGLNDFPPDVIRDALRAWARQERFRPSLAEAREYCWVRFKRRHRVRTMLRHAIAMGEPPLADEPPTPEERAKVAVMIAESKKALVDVSALTPRQLEATTERRDRPSADAMELVRQGMVRRGD